MLRGSGSMLVVVVSFCLFFRMATFRSYVFPICTPKQKPNKKKKNPSIYLSIYQRKENDSDLVSRLVS